ncbi:MAG: cytochrome c [Rhodospirillaceae bacterium]|jgi:mono/diheme cytochrome c family protein|nr:cytochrome c [Rhodospirillaceae bacterium]MBT5242792.1 cytochrome c [Rhodospirillaceae bacterium]MBT6243268.1 cytochrome c [Rhodospirillaceae bacterium]
MLTVRLLISGLIIMAFGIVTMPIAKSDELTINTSNLTDILDGGMLYDNWISVLEADKPGATHALWPASNTKKKGGTTWRCKSCHGWDFMGKDGAYASGSYKTGIKGIRASAGKAPAEVAKMLRGPKHGYTAAMIPDAALNKVALFVAKGQYSLDVYIDRASKKAKGNVAIGKVFYDTSCNRCHGDDGREMNFKTPDKPEYLGTLSNGNPWETINKIRHGQPDSQMPALGALGLQTMADILAYLQTLPLK